MLWIGAVEDAKSIDDRITSASVKEETILDLKNFDFKIASGHTKIQTGNFKKQITTAQGKGQPEKRSRTG